jgi:hypothetical protein
MAGIEGQRPYFRREMSPDERGSQTRSVIPVDQNWKDQDVPYEQLVNVLRHFVERAKADYTKREEQGEAIYNHPEIKNTFNVAEFLGHRLEEDAWKRGLRGEDPISSDLFYAWTALAHPYYTTTDNDTGTNWKEASRFMVESYILDTGRASITLPPKGVKLIDAMAEVAGIPRKRGEATIDLTPFTAPQ